MYRTLDAIDTEIKEVKGRTFKHLGDLLIEIVDRKLFQERGFTNVEDYFQSEPHLPSARQAFRLIAATRFSRQLPDTVQQPKSERQVRPLLGKRKEESRLLWTIATLVANERSHPLDGKLVATVVKDYENGLLQEFIPTAVDILGDSYTTVSDDVAAKKVARKDPECVRRENRTETHSTTISDSRSPLIQTSSDLYYVTGILCAAWGIPSNDLDSLLTYLRSIERENCSLKRRRAGSCSRTEVQTVTTLLGQILERLVDLCSMMGIPLLESSVISSHNTPASQVVMEVPGQNPVEPTSLEQPTPNKRLRHAASSEDEITVAEALLTLSNSSL